MKKIRAKYPDSHSIGEMKGKDNQNYYNTRGRSMACSRGIFERVPSLKKSKKTWENFYNLFPYVKELLITLGEEGYWGKNPIRVTLDGNIYTVVDERIHGSLFHSYLRRRTTKFLKIW